MRKAFAILAIVAMTTDSALADRAREQALFGGALGGAVGAGREGGIVGSPLGAAIGVAVPPEREREYED
jgi:hypothetical protein